MTSPIEHGYRPEDRGPLRLCYARDGWAWFVDMPVEYATGDGWDGPARDASPPHEWTPADGVRKGMAEWRVVKVAWDVPFTAAFHRYPYDINQHGQAWLMGDWPILAGTDLDTFARIVQDAGGQVYAPMGVEL